MLLGLLWFVRLQFNNRVVSPFVIARRLSLRLCESFLSSSLRGVSPFVIAGRFSFRHCEARSAEAISQLITLLILVPPNPGETNLPFLSGQSLSPPSLRSVSLLCHCGASLPPSLPVVSPPVIARHEVPKQSRS